MSQAERIDIREEAAELVLDDARHIGAAVTAAVGHVLERQVRIEVGLLLLDDGDDGHQQFLVRLHRLGFLRRIGQLVPVRRQGGDDEPHGRNGVEQLQHRHHHGTACQGSDPGEHDVDDRHQDPFPGGYHREIGGVGEAVLIAEAPRPLDDEPQGVDADQGDEEAEDIEDDPGNFTRFLVIVSNSCPSNKSLSYSAAPNMVSFIFNTKNEPGALYNVLGVFQNCSLNLTRLESRPIEGQPWKYWFFAVADIKSRKDVEGVMEDLRAATEEVRVLGIY